MPKCALCYVGSLFPNSTHFGYCGYTKYLKVPVSSVFHAVSIMTVVVRWSGALTVIYWDVWSPGCLHLSLQFQDVIRANSLYCVCIIYDFQSREREFKLHKALVHPSLHAAACREGCTSALCNLNSNMLYILGHLSDAFVQSDLQ